MTQFAPEEIARLRELAALATQESWKFGFDREIRRQGTSHEIYEISVVAIVHSSSSPKIAFERTYSDIAYLETAANQFPAALDEIERLHEVVGRAARELKIAIDSGHAEWGSDIVTFLTDALSGGAK